MHNLKIFKINGLYDQTIPLALPLWLRKSPWRSHHGQKVEGWGSCDIASALWGCLTWNCIVRPCVIPCLHMPNSLAPRNLHPEWVAATAPVGEWGRWDIFTTLTWHSHSARRTLFNCKSFKLWLVDDWLMAKSIHILPKSSLVLNYNWLHMGYYSIVLRSWLRDL